MDKWLLLFPYKYTEHLLSCLMMLELINPLDLIKKILIKKNIWIIFEEK